jgi:choline kinase
LSFSGPADLPAAMRPIGASQTVFVGDTRVEEVITSFPDLSFCVSPRWQIDGPRGSLMSAPIEVGTTIFVSYTDVVYGSEIVEPLKGRDEDAVLVVDCAWRDRYSGRPLVDQMSAWARPLGSSSA